MASLVLVVLVLAMVGPSSATWCVCKDVSESVLQKTLDYACGAGADCNPIHSTGSCYNPNNVRAHCNYAVNSYFQRKAQAPGTCDFTGSAAISTSDPSSTGCVYPSSASAATTPVTSTGTPTTPTTRTPTTPTTGTPTIATPTGTSPLVNTPSTGVMGGIGTPLGPSGVGINTDTSHGGAALLSLFSVFLAFMATSLVFLWG